MKKEIIINASKDRSRIAIVEDGQLAELYVEHPDNVRTLGNIYLGRVRKIMPALHAAFVDIGQKQDAFLHFSDLTENLPALMEMVGETVPGLKGRALARAPQKRVADDEGEAEVEDVLEVETPDEEAEPRPAGRARRSRGGRGRLGGRRGAGPEDEEEEEEVGPDRPRPASRFVIDLSKKPQRPASAPPQRAPEPVATDLAPDAAGPLPTELAPDAAGPLVAVAAMPTDEPPDETPAEAPVDAAAPKTRSRRTKKTAAPEASDTDASLDDAEAAAEAPAAKPPRKSRARRPADAVVEADPLAEDAPVEPVAAEADEDAVAEAPAPRTTRARSRKKADAPAPADAEAADAPDAIAPDEMDAESALDLDAPTADPAEGDDEHADGERPRRRRGRRGGRGRRRGDRADDGTEAGDATGEMPADAAPEDVPARLPAEPGSADGDADIPAESDAPAPSRRGRSRKAAEPTADADADAPAEKPARGRRTAAKPSDAPAAERAPRAPAAGRADARPIVAFTGRPESLLRRDGPVLVKITKEPISLKGSRVSTDISLAGRFLVLVPAADYVAVSKKIASAKERRRLRTLAGSLKPEGFGVIVRTVAADRDAKTLDTDLRLLLDKWRKIEAGIAEKPAGAKALYEDVGMVSSIVRDLFTEDYERILVDDPKLHKNLKAYVLAVAPHMADNVVLHRSNVPVFRAAGLEKAVEEVFQSRVNLPGGGYLYIEHTEAMHVVDVNSGRAGRGLSQSENLLRVNLEAAREVARQLRLRDLGGIIVVDFIDMRSEADRRKIYAALKDGFKRDRAVTKLLPMSDFGLIEITRQRLRPSITTPTSRDGMIASDAARAAGAGEIEQPSRYDDSADAPEMEADFPYAEGDGYAAPVRTPGEAVTPEALVERLGTWLKHYREVVPERYRDRPVILRVHPLFASYLRRGLVSPLTKWRWFTGRVPFRLEEDAAFDPLAFDVRDEKSGKSLTRQYAPPMAPPAE